MIKILLAGSGCFLGKCLLVANYNGELITKEVEDDNGVKIYDELKVLFSTLGADKSEVVELGKDSSFTKFFNELVDLGFTNVIRTKRDPLDLTNVQQIFEESLYKLGVHESVKCKENDFQEFNSLLQMEVALKPELDSFVRESYKKSKHYTALLHKCDVIRDTCSKLLS